MPRVRLDGDDDVEEESGYFLDSHHPLDFISAGCAVLDCALGGGWALKRIGNIIGDESTGKTLLAIEALANFNVKYPNGEMFYRESEYAFDEDYANSIGMPTGKVRFIDPGDLVTVEDFYNDLINCADLCIKGKVPGIYYLDTLDGLSDQREMAAKFGEASYNMGKAKDLHKLFRLASIKIAQANMHLGVISQTKDMIGSMFVQKTISGGNALKFWSSQRLMLSYLKEETKTMGKVKKVIGVRIKAKCIKNKTSLPRRQCEFVIRFGQGVDSILSSLIWLEEIFRLDEVIGDGSRSTYEKNLLKMSDKEYWEESRRVDSEVFRIWKEVEQPFIEIARPKYREVAP